MPTSSNLNKIPTIHTVIITMIIYSMIFLDSLISNDFSVQFTLSHIHLLSIIHPHLPTRASRSWWSEAEKPSGHRHLKSLALFRIFLLSASQPNYTQTDATLGLLSETEDTSNLFHHHLPGHRILLQSGP